MSVDINQTLTALASLEDRKEDILDQLKVIKTQTKYTKVLKQITDYKKQVYDYMMANEMETCGPYDLKDVTPSSEIKKERKEAKAKKLGEILDKELADGEYDVEDLSSKLAEIWSQWKIQHGVVFNYFF